MNRRELHAGRMPNNSMKANNIRCTSCKPVRMVLTMKNITSEKMKEKTTNAPCNRNIKTLIGSNMGISPVVSTVRACSAANFSTIQT